MSSQSSSITRDEKYYFQQAIFLVEDRLFKVPVLHFCEESDVFRTMFQLPQNPGSDVDGLTDERPIILEGVKKADFEQLLRIMYSRGHREPEKFTTEQWASVLLLSSKWDMDNLQRLAISQITPVLVASPHDLVLWGRKYDVESWRLSGVEALVDRKDAMNEEDANVLGLSFIFKLAAVRERLKDSAIEKYKNGLFGRRLAEFQAERVELLKTLV